MRVEEAKYIGTQLRKLVNKEKEVILNIGSSSGNYRKIEQPHVYHEIFSYFENTNTKVIHSDIKELNGVDISGDIFDEKMQDKLKSVCPSFVLACNLMEHLPEEKRSEFPCVLDNIVGKEGYIILTVPYSYPLHLDPIDTYYRPTPEKLYSLFPSYNLIDMEIIVSSSFFIEIRKLNWHSKLKLVLRLALPFYHFKVWLCLVHRFLWLFRPYKVSCVILQKK